MGDVENFVAALPKVDLHRHLVGSASPETVAALARRHPEQRIPDDLDAVEKFFRFTDFPHFIEVYSAVNGLITSGTDIVELITGLATELVAEHIRYAELTVTPMSHVRAGIDPVELAEALDEGRRLAERVGDVELAWIVDISGDLGVRSGLDTVDWLVRHGPAGVVGFGLGGPELGVPRADFRDAFDRARAAGFRSVPHAGETVGPEEVWSAVRDLRADRIGHGIQSVRDPALLRHLAEHGVALEVCLTSNVCTSAVPSLDAHPLPELIAAGVPVALGTDDPGMFDTSLNREYVLCQRLLDASRGELADLARSAVRAAFCSESLRGRLLGEIDAAESHGPR